jgi:hypothetical protein
MYNKFCVFLSTGLTLWKIERFTWKDSIHKPIKNDQDEYPVLRDDKAIDLHHIPISRVCLVS